MSTASNLRELLGAANLVPMVATWAIVAAGEAGQALLPEFNLSRLTTEILDANGLREQALDWPDGTPAWRRQDLDDAVTLSRAAETTILVAIHRGTAPALVMFLQEGKAVIVVPGLDHGVVMLVDRTEAERVLVAWLGLLEAEGTEWSATRRDSGHRTAVLGSTADELWAALPHGERPPSLEVALKRLLDGEPGN